MGSLEARKTAGPRSFPSPQAVHAGSFKLTVRRTSIEWLQSRSSALTRTGRREKQVSPTPTRSVGVVILVGSCSGQGGAEESSHCCLRAFSLPRFVYRGT